MPVDAHALATRLQGCHHVRGLHPGPHHTILTPTNAGPVIGVLVTPSMIVLGLVIGPRVDAERLASRVRAHLAQHAPGVPVSLAITRPPARTRQTAPCSTDELNTSRRSQR